MVLSIIIVNYNTKKLTVDCIKSIFKFAPKFSFEVIVVDNGSHEVFDIDINKKNLKIIKNNVNLGFSKANNIGIAKSSGEYVMLLNSDTVVTPSVLDELVEFAKNHSDAGVVAPKLLNFDKSTQSSVFNFPTIRGAITQYWLKRGKVLDKYVPNTDEPKEVDAVVAAAFLITPRALKEVGKLDEKYFMYFEDLDYCRKVKSLGLKVYYVPSATVFHLHGASGNEKTNSFTNNSSKKYFGTPLYYLYTLVLWTGTILTRKSGTLLLFIIILGTVIRLWGISTTPPSLFGDELDVGYQSYSVLKTGRDYSGNVLPFDFQGLAEWRTPLYLYSSVPSVAVFGISPLGVRLPAALFGIATIPVLYYLTKRLTNSVDISLLSALLLAISPWHLQYSRAAFEVTELVFLLSLGLLMFIKSLKEEGSVMWLSLVLFVLTAWTYNTAKLFTPLFVISLFVIHYREVLRIPRKRLLMAFIVPVVLSIPLLYSTFLGGGAQRINDINLFSKPINETMLAQSRSFEKNALLSKVFNNKITVYGDRILLNYLAPFSVDFLFTSGDVNPRHSIEGMGMFYKIEIIGLVLGLIFLLSEKFASKNKLILGSLVILGVIPSSLTIGGAVHATRLILILLPLIIIISIGWINLLHSLKYKKIKYVAGLIILILYVASFISYEHMYFVDNRIQSQKWWHYGWEETIKSAISISSSFENVVISTKDEPPWIFFASWSQFNPVIWHKGYPFKKHTLSGFGEVSFMDKFSFGSPQNGGVYDWGKVIDEKTLYVANADEVNVDLIHEPERLPHDLVLIKSISYLDGTPAFYLLTHSK